MVTASYTAKCKDKRLGSILLRELAMAKGGLQELANNWSQQLNCSYVSKGWLGSGMWPSQFSKLEPFNPTIKVGPGQDPGTSLVPRQGIEGSQANDFLARHCVRPDPSSIKARTKSCLSSRCSGDCIS